MEAPATNPVDAKLEGVLMAYMRMESAIRDLEQTALATGVLPPAGAEAFYRRQSLDIGQRIVDIRVLLAQHKQIKAAAADAFGTWIPILTSRSSIGSTLVWDSFCVEPAATQMMAAQCGCVCHVEGSTITAQRTCRQHQPSEARESVAVKANRIDAPHPRIVDMRWDAHMRG